MRMTGVVAMVSALAACAGERAEFLLPQGQAAAGQEAVREQQCFACHEFAGSTLPAPHAALRAPRLGAKQARWTRERLADRILTPAHPLAEGRMGDYTEAMTVRQLIDIVAYLQSLEQRESGAR
jgi:cytochrome c2